MIGVKIYQKPEDVAWALQQWQELGIDTVFIGPKLRQEYEFIAQIKASNRLVIAIFPVYYDKVRLQEHPEEFAVLANGEQASQEWIKFACPSSTHFMAHKLDELEDVIEKVKPDAVSFDFMRFFVYWEKVTKQETDNLKQSCFDDRCLQRFVHETGIVIRPELRTVAEKADWILDVYADAWAKWKCAVIETAVKQLTTHARTINPKITLGLHSVPWLADDYDGAVRAIAGQNLDTLAQYVDFFTPMCYSHMVKENPNWVNEIVQGQTEQGGLPVVPSIQVEKAYREETFMVDEFTATIEFAQKEPSQGIVYWSWEALARSEEKLTVAKRLSVKNVA